jgi:ABC-type transporter Mla subunit MlaD
MALRPVRLLAVALTLAAAAGCAGPSRTDDDYRHKAANTAETMQGLIGTAQLAVDAASRHKVPTPYLSVTLSEADDDASATEGTFDSVQPPSDQADQLRDKLDTLLQNTTSVLDDLRIAVRGGDISSLSKIAAPLKDLNDKLQSIVDLA